MRKKIAQKFSHALEIIRDCYYAKLNNLTYSKAELFSAEQYLTDIGKFINKASGDIERAFLFCCLDSLDIIKAEGDFAKLSRYANAIIRVPFIFTGEEKWNKSFKNEHIYPFCQMYGEEYFEEILDIQIPIEYRAENDKKTIYKYNEMTIMSLPAYFAFRMLFPLIIIPILIGFMLYIHYSDYTEKNHGERYKITVSSYECGEDYLEIRDDRYEDDFEIARFREFAEYPDEILKICEDGGALIIYANHKTSGKYEDHYDVCQIESTTGEILLSYQSANKMDKYYLIFLAIIVGVIFVPYFILFVMMLIVALNPKAFIRHPRFVKFCFPDYSLRLRR